MVVEVAGLQLESQGAGQLVAALVTVVGTCTSEHWVTGCELQTWRSKIH